MILTLDNNDGAGARDYTRALVSSSPLTVSRSRTGATQAAQPPDRLRAVLDLASTSLPVPARLARAVVTTDGGAVLFTGTLPSAPAPVAAGIAATGPVDHLHLEAIADIQPAPGLVPPTAAAHSFTPGDGTLHLSPRASAPREFARDLTLSGAIEPAAYINQTFLGDGTTAVFDLAEPPFHPTGSATLLDERFDRDRLDPRLWTVNDPGGVLSLSSAGFTASGGNGLDGTTALASATPFEIAGTLILVTDGVLLQPASDGVLCGLYTGQISRESCLAGFNVRPSGGNTIVTPLVNGVETGASLTVLSGHRYRLRLRLHCTESVRFAATCTALADGQPHSFGGEAVPAPVTLLFEAQDLGLASNTPATVLATASVAASPIICTFAPIHAIQLNGSIASCSIQQAGSAWITSTTSSGTQTVRLTGAEGDGVDCTLSSTGRITFFAGRIPIANEIVSVTYRSHQRSIARLGTTGSDTGIPTAAWQGHVLHPPARTSADCENATQAALAASGARSATLTGDFTTLNPDADIQPGDTLDLTTSTQSAGITDSLNLTVTGVTITQTPGLPEQLLYRIAFANDWSHCLDASLADTAAEDALLPLAPTAAPPVFTANLPALTVTGITATTISIDTGIAPPTGGGFEVRRRDGGFGPGASNDLVLRATTRAFSIPRTAQLERYYIRPYDASPTPIYSRFSSAIFTSLPYGS